MRTILELLDGWAHVIPSGARNHYTEAAQRIRELEACVAELEAERAQPARAVEDAPRRGVFGRIGRFDRP